MIPPSVLVGFLSMPGKALPKAPPGRIFPFPGRFAGLRGKWSAAGGLRRGTKKGCILWAASKRSLSAKKGPAFGTGLAWFG
jgi:hypothetical protein